MDVAIVTGSCGLVGSAVTEMLIGKGMRVVGIDSDTRGTIFGLDASIGGMRTKLLNLYGGRQYQHEDIDIRNEGAVYSIFHTLGDEVSLVVHTAGQPSHDWSAQAPMVDFDINARATLILLECVRNWCPEAPFVFMSTNKVYGDWVNNMTYEETATRWQPKGGIRSILGVNETAPIDHSMHSPFGCSKAAADLYVQEYGRYFDIPTVCFRCGCITGDQHRAVRLHGFLAYLAKRIRLGLPYTIFGYKGKQVRDNIHASDLAEAIWRFYKEPRVSAVYNMGGGFMNSCSILEAIQAMTAMLNKSFAYEVVEEPRVGDHKWWISDTTKFQADYPGWEIQWDLMLLYSSLLGVDNGT